MAFPFEQKRAYRTCASWPCSSFAIMTMINVAGKPPRNRPTKLSEIKNRIASVREHTRGKLITTRNRRRCILEKEEEESQVSRNYIRVARILPGELHTARKPEVKLVNGTIDVISPQ